MHDKWFNYTSGVSGSNLFNSINQLNVYCIVYQNTSMNTIKYTTNTNMSIVSRKLFHTIFMFPANKILYNTSNSNQLLIGTNLYCRLFKCSAQNCSFTIETQCK